MHISNQTNCCCISYPNEWCKKNLTEGDVAKSLFLNRRGGWIFIACKSLMKIDFKTYNYKVIREWGFVTIFYMFPGL